MRVALLVVTAIAAFLAYQAWRVAVTIGSQSAAMLAFVLIAATVGLLAAALLSAGKVRDFLPVRAVRIWLNRARAWADRNERKP